MLEKSQKKVNRGGSFGILLLVSKMVVVGWKEVECCQSASDSYMVL